MEEGVWVKKDCVHPINLPMLLNTCGGIGPALLYYEKGRELLFMGIIDEIVRPGFVCIDVGANIGYTTLAMLKNVGPDGVVYSIEPEPRCVNLLKANIELNNFQDISEVSECVISNETGTTTFWMAHSPNLSSIHKRESGSIEQIEVPCFTLEDFLKDRRYPNFIKMDIEGHEVYVMESGLEYFKNNRGTTSFLIECHPYVGNPKCNDPNRDFVPVLEKYFEMGFKPKYTIAGRVPENINESEHPWDLKYPRIKEMWTDGFYRALYQDITEEDLINITLREQQESRSFMITREN